MESKQKVVNSESTDKEPLFRDLKADDNEIPERTEIESLCMNCGKNGTTRLLLTRIPYYKDVIIMSFECEHCGYRNNEIDSGGKVMEKGVRITLTVTTLRDLNRQVVKSDHTCIRIPSLEFEIPAGSQKGEITTIEGIIERSIDGLQQNQDKRREEDPEVAENLDKFIEKLKNLKLMEDSFIIVFEDISGNCHIENPKAPTKDERCNVVYFDRTLEQNHALGIYPENVEESDPVLLKPTQEGECSLEDIDGQVLTFQTNCPNCNAPAETNMKMTKIPYFKEAVIMATTCEACGCRTNEVKSGGGIEPMGVRFEVRINGKEDFSRDLLKSETCRMEIPELELEVGPTTLGGRFTTVEGIISSVKEQLASSTAYIGDSADPETVKKFDNFISELERILRGESSVTLVLDDPAGNSYIQSLSENHLPDENLKIMKYERSFEQNEELGLNDMKTENY